MVPMETPVIRVMNTREVAGVGAEGLGISSGHIKFELPLRHPKRDVK